MKKTIIALLAASGMTYADIGVDVEVEFLNRHVDLGEDVEPGTRFLRAGIGTEVHGADIGLEAFQAVGGGDYNEISLGISYDVELGGLVLTPGFTWLWFPDDSDDTAEISLGFELPVVGVLEFFGEFAFDIFDSEGFVELGLAAPYSFPVGGLEVEITPSVTLGVDFGMVSGDRSLKENNVVLSLELSVPVTEQAEVFAGIHHSFALGALKDADGRDVSWFGVGVALGF